MKYVINRVFRLVVLWFLQCQSIPLIPRRPSTVSYPIIVIYHHKISHVRNESLQASLSTDGPSVCHYCTMCRCRCHCPRRRRRRRKKRERNGKREKRAVLVSRRVAWVARKVLSSWIKYFYRLALRTGSTTNGSVRVCESVDCIRI